MKKNIFFLFVTIFFFSLTSCKREHRINYVAVPVDSMQHDDFEQSKEEWKDEPLFDIPESPGEADINNAAGTDELEQILKGK